MEKAPAIGDRVKVRPDIDDLAAGRQGQVLRLRVRRDGVWLDAELDIDGAARWFSREQLDYVTRPRGTVGAPKGDFVRVERRSGRRANELDLHLYIGRALLARWRENSGDFRRVAIDMVDGQLTLRASADGPFALDATPGRMPRIHCDRARAVITLPDGRYAARIAGDTLVVLGPINGDG
jgi:hypothetical protein